MLERFQAAVLGLITYMCYPVKLSDLWNVFCETMGMKLSTLHRWSKYTAYSWYTGRIESILVLVLAVLAVPTEEILPVLAVPAM